MTPEELDELERLAKAATPGPWRWYWRRDDEAAPGSVFSEHTAGHAYAVAMCPRYGKPAFEHNAAFIAAARTTVPELIDEVRELRGLLHDAPCPDCGHPWMQGHVCPKEQLREHGGCSHCWHSRRGPILMVVPDGHDILECCRCHAIQTVHREYR